MTFTFGFAAPPAPPFAAFGAAAATGVGTTFAATGVGVGGATGALSALCSFIDAATAGTSVALADALTLGDTLRDALREPAEVAFLDLDFLDLFFFGAIACSSTGVAQCGASTGVETRSTRSSFP